jgi:hypothetical protein
VSVRVRKPCQDCGGPKGPGRGERYCATCASKLHVPSVPPDVQAAIVRAYNRPRATLRGVAAEFYVSQGSVSRVLEIHGVDVRPRGHYGTPRLAVDEQLLRTQLYGQGHSLAGVAAIVGRCPSSVADTLRRNGVRLRPVGVNLTPHVRYTTRGARGRFAGRETT